MASSSDFARYHFRGEITIAVDSAPALLLRKFKSIWAGPASLQSLFSDPRGPFTALSPSSKSAGESLG
jgi:hypothetical protein